MKMENWFHSTVNEFHSDYQSKKFDLNLVSAKDAYKITIFS